MIIEVMRRILGNMYHVPGNMLTGMDWEYWETRVRCGLPLDDMPVFQKQEGYFAYKAVIADKNGVFSGIKIPKAFDKYQYKEYWLKNIGYIVENHQSDPLGFLFFIFSSNEEMKESLIDRYNEFEVIIDD